MPAKSMVLVLENKELWVGCGNKIVIVDTTSLAIMDEIAVYQTQRTHVRIMVTDGTRVWSADRRSSKILQWEVSSRQLTNIFDCDVNNPVGHVLNTDVRESRRFTARKGDRGRFSGRDRTVSDPPDMRDPSFTEAMFKEAMARSKSEEDGETDSQSRDDSLPRRTGSSSEFVVGATGNGPPENSGDMDSEKAQFALSRFRSLSAETDSNDSGISSFRSTATVPVDASIASGTSRSRAQDLQTKDDSVPVTSENVSSVVEKTAPVGSNQNVVEQDIESHRGTTTYDTSETSPMTSPVDNNQKITGGAQKESGDKTAEVDKETDTKEPLDKDEGADFELVDRDETRQAFIEGARKSTGSESASTQQCASMVSLRQPFNSPSRAPSLMSSTKRKSQRRRETNEDNKSQPTKPWAARPRLRILAGSINRVTALLLVNGTLWIGRGIGDVLTMNVNSANNDLPLGHVFAQLESDNLLGYENGQVDEIVNSGTDKVVCLRRLETPRGSIDTEDRGMERYQLVVWEAWGDAEFRKFRSRLEEFNSLVE